MADTKYTLRYLPLFYEDLEQKVVYIAKNLHNEKAANELLDAVERAILERQPVAEAFEPYHSMKERRYPYYRIYVKNFVVWYVVIDDEGEDKIMDYSDLLELHIIELRKKLTGNSRLDDWIRLFNAETEEDLHMIKTKNAGVQRAKYVIQEMSLTESLREATEYYRKKKMDRKSEDAYVYDQGKEAGEQIGMKRGIEQGIEAFILDNLEENIPKERIIEKLQKRFDLSQMKAESYIERYIDKDR